MKKTITLIALILITCGCEINYTLEIDENNLTETTIFQAQPTKEIPTQNLTSQELYTEYINKPIPLSNYTVIEAYSNEKSEGIDYYETKDLSNQNTIKVRYKGNFTKQNIIESTFINDVYPDFKLTEENNQITITTGNTFKLFKEYPNLTKATINIKTNQKVTQTNADQINQNIYTWIVDQTNYTNKPINLTIEKQQNIKEKIQQVEISSASKDIFIIYGTIILLIIITIIIIKIKLTNKNKI